MPHSPAPPPLPPQQLNLGAEEGGTGTCGHHHKRQLGPEYQKPSVKERERNRWREKEGEVEREREGENRCVREGK